MVPDDHVIVLFGATGDLAARKLLPGFFELTQAGLMPRDYRVIGTSPDAMSDEDFAEHTRDVVGQYGRIPAEGPAWDAFIGRVRYASSSSDDASALADAVAAAAGELGGSPRVLHYLSIPPVAMGDIVRAIGAAGLAAGGAKVILEKPFGTDVESAKALNALLHSVFAEEQIYRIDHFLGKEDVQNILAVRFANRLFEPIWSTEHIEEIQIDVPETLGGREPGRVLRRDRRVPRHGRHAPVPGARLRDHGAARRVLPRRARDEKQRVFHALQPVDTSKVVRGQYEGYRALPDVPDDSDTETLVALEARIDNPRWDGVPIHLRTGKRMPTGARVITLNLRRPPLHMFPADATCHGDKLVFEIGEPGSIRIVFQTKEPGPEMTLGGSAHGLRLQDELRPAAGARGLRAAAARRDARRPHAVHARGGHRAPVGGRRAAARRAPAGPALRPGHLGAARGRRARGPAGLAPGRGVLSVARRQTGGSGGSAGGSASSTSTRSARR